MFRDAPSTTVVLLMTVLLVLQIFFEGVQECIAAGVKEDEVGYQLAFSKQELRKCIKEYPAKELKKGLEQLYKKVEKHLCEEENLLQVLCKSRESTHTFKDSSNSFGIGRREDVCFFWPVIFEGLPQVFWRSAQYADQVIL